MNFPDLIERYNSATLSNQEEIKLNIESQLIAIIDEPISIDKYAYSDGYIGLGACILFILGNKVTDEELNITLSDVDKMFIKIVDKRPPIGTNSPDGILSLLVYIYLQLSINIDQNSYIFLDLKERAIYLLDWIEDCFDDFDRIELFFSLLLYLKLNIYNYKAYGLIYRLLH